MADIMDKTEEFFKALEKANIELTAGQTVIVCNDGAVMVDVDIDSDSDSGACDVIMCNNKIDFDYNLGITDEDVELFKTVAGVAQELEDQIEEDE